MDLLDKSIILELMSNSRVSCQELAEKYNSTRGVVRKRIRKLEQTGVIQLYGTWYNLAMIDAVFVIGHARVSQQLRKETLLGELLQHPMIHVVIPVATGDIIFHAIAIGTEGLSELGSSIRRLDNITEVELHLVQYDLGKKTELKTVHFNILSVLFENSRISISEIARKTSLSVRRVKRALDEMISGQGISMAISRNPALGQGLSFYAKITWDERESNVSDLIKHIEKEFPTETWESYISASDPIVFIRFFVEHIKNVESITNTISQLKEVKFLETLIFYPARISSILTREHLKEDIVKAGFDVCHS